MVMYGGRLYRDRSMWMRTISANQRRIQRPVHDAGTKIHLRIVRLYVLTYVCTSVRLSSFLINVLQPDTGQVTWRVTWRLYTAIHHDTRRTDIQQSLRYIALRIISTHGIAMPKGLYFTAVVSSSSFFFFWRLISEVTELISIKLEHIFTYNCYRGIWKIWSELPRVLTPTGWGQKPLFNIFHLHTTLLQWITVIIHTCR